MKICSWCIFHVAFWGWLCLFVDLVRQLCVKDPEWVLYVSQQLQLPLLEKRTPPSTPRSLAHPPRMALSLNMNPISLLRCPARPPLRAGRVGRPPWSLSRRGQVHDGERAQQSATLLPASPPPCHSLLWLCMCASIIIGLVLWLSQSIFHTVVVLNVMWFLSQGALLWTLFAAASWLDDDLHAGWLLLNVTICWFDYWLCLVESLLKSAHGPLKLSHSFLWGWECLEWLQHGYTVCLSGYLLSTNSIHGLLTEWVDSVGQLSLSRPVQSNECNRGGSTLPQYCSLQYHSLNWWCCWLTEIIILQE